MEVELRVEVSARKEYVALEAMVWRGAIGVDLNDAGCSWTRAFSELSLRRSFCHFGRNEGAAMSALI